MHFSKRFKIGVFGSAAGSEVENLTEKAFTIGREIARRNCILETGARPGLPHAAALGADSVGGLILGFSPAMNLAEHIERFKFPDSPYVLIFSGFEKKGRNIISTRSCDASIFLSGRTGTMSEFAMFYDEADAKKVIGLLKGSGGFVGDYLTDFVIKTEKKTKAHVVLNDDPVVLVDQVVGHLIRLNPDRVR